MENLSKKLSKLFLLMAVMIAGVENIQAAPTKTVLTGSIDQVARTFIVGYAWGGFSAAEAFQNCNMYSNSVELPNYQSDYSNSCKLYFTAAYGKPALSVWTQTTCVPAHQVIGSNPRVFVSERFSNNPFLGLKITCVKP